MNQHERADLLTRLAEVSDDDLDVADITDTDLLQDLGIESLDAVMLVLDLEEYYDIDVGDDEVAALDTVGSLLALLDSKRAINAQRP